MSRTERPFCPGQLVKIDDFSDFVPFFRAEPDGTGFSSESDHKSLRVQKDLRGTVTKLP